MGDFLSTIWNAVLYYPFINLLFAFYFLFGQNLGIAVILLAVIMRLILIPSTKKQTDMAKKLSILRPKLADLQKKYKNNQDKLAKEQLKLYKEVGYNPLGCFGSFIAQFIIIIVIFNVIQVVGTGSLRLQSAIYSGTNQTLTITYLPNHTVVADDQIEADTLFVKSKAWKIVDQNGNKTVPVLPSFDGTKWNFPNDFKQLIDGDQATTSSSTSTNTTNVAKLTNTEAKTTTSDSTSSTTTATTSIVALKSDVTSKTDENNQYSVTFYVGDLFTEIDGKAQKLPDGTNMKDFFRVKRPIGGLYPFVSDLAGTRYIGDTNFLGIDLSRDYNSVIAACDCIQGEGLLRGVSAYVAGPFVAPGAAQVAIMALLVGIIQYYSTTLMQFVQGNITNSNKPKKKGKNEEVSPEEMQAKLNGSMNLLFPVMTVFIAFSTPAVLGIYWIAQSLFIFVQYSFTDRAKVKEFFLTRVMIVKLIRKLKFNKTK